MKTKKKYLSLVLGLAFLVLMIPTNAFAGPNPSANVQNGEIWMWEESSLISTSEPDFNVPLYSGQVLVSQQIIADNGDGTFNVELKIRGADDVLPVYDEAIVFVLDESGSITNSS